MDERPQRMTELDIFFVGGANEVGLNATAHQFGQDLVVTDFGAFLGDLHASVQRVVPSVDALHRDGRRLRGVFLSHGHEDHIGALSQLLARAPVPIYGPAFAIELVRSRLQEMGRERRAELYSVEPGRPFELGPFKVEFVSVTHSIPDSVMVLVETPAGRTLDTGDFKLDRAPRGPLTDLDRLRAIGDEGLDVLLSDSTNAERPGRTQPETEVHAALEDEVCAARGRVVVTLFASHVHRMAGLVDIAERTDRRILLAGYSMQRNWAIGQKLGLLPPGDGRTTTPDGARRLRPRDLLILATGTQGEPGGAMARLARGHGVVDLEPGDTVLWSARAIPGRELAIRDIFNRLIGQGVLIRTAKQRPALHTSGHAQQDEHLELYDLVRPRYLVPFHGDRTMMEAQAETARRWGMDPSRILIPANGSIFTLEDGELSLRTVEDVTPMPIDRHGQAMEWGTVRTRERMGRSGALFVQVPRDEAGWVRRAPLVVPVGLELDSEDVDRVSRAVAAMVNEAKTADRSALDEVVIRAVQTSLRMKRFALPWIEVRVTADA
ncbi:MAG: ribonuclease J [Myxococcota bacterium]